MKTRLPAFEEPEAVLLILVVLDDRSAQAELPTTHIAMIRKLM